MDTIHLSDSAYDDLTVALARLAEGERPNLLDIMSEVRLALAEANIFSTSNRDLTDEVETVVSLTPAA